jgi:hypothetical protein
MCVVPLCWRSFEIGGVNVVRSATDCALAVLVQK